MNEPTPPPDASTTPTRKPRSTTTNRPLGVEVKQRMMVMSVGVHELVRLAKEGKPPCIPRVNPVLDERAFALEIQEEITRRDEAGNSLLAEALKKAARRLFANKSKTIKFPRPNQSPRKRLKFVIQPANEPVKVPEPYAVPLTIELPEKVEPVEISIAHENHPEPTERPRDCGPDRSGIERAAESSEPAASVSDGADRYTGVG